MICEGSATLETVALAHEQHLIKLQVDAWIIQYDRWLTKKAMQASKTWKIANDRRVWEDIKSELIIEAYAVGKRFDTTRGVSLSKFLVNSLWQHGTKPCVVKRYIRSAKEDQQCNTSDTSAASWGDNHSFEKTDKNSVYSLLEGLDPHEQMLIRLHFEHGYSYEEIGEMLGLKSALGSAWNRIQKAIEKIKVSGNGF